MEDLGSMVPIGEATEISEMIFAKFIDINHDGQTTLQELQMGTYCLLRTAAQLGLQFMGNENAELDMSIFPDFEEMSQVKIKSGKQGKSARILGSSWSHQLRGSRCLLQRPPKPQK